MQERQVAVQKRAKSTTISTTRVTTIKPTMITVPSNNNQRQNKVNIGHLNLLGYIYFHLSKSVIVHH